MPLTPRRNLARPSALPQLPDISDINISCDQSAEYAVVISIERARDAKTQGATLVEAGKINESLMYLGQCLQTQSEALSSNKPNVVPYRQSGQPYGARHNPQRGVIVVTADPRGDFNATSQILRYSALAREVTVPRIPSITATILAQPPPTGNPRPLSPVQQQHPRPFLPPSAPNSYRNHTPPMNIDDRATMEIAALEIAKMSDEIDQLRLEVDEQLEARLTAEAHLLSMEDRMLDLEAVIRDECADEFEQRLMLELARFKTSLALEQERNDEHWDRKVDILERGLDATIDDSDGNKENLLVEDLTQEVERLRRENAILRRELAGRTPSKRKPLEEREGYFPSSGGATASYKSEGIAIIGQKLERMRLSTDTARSSIVHSSGSPKKMRKLASTKPWEQVRDESL